MKYTEEQQQIIDNIFSHDKSNYKGSSKSELNLYVNALAGTGKTTTCFGVINESIKANKSVLYLVFNKSMQIEANNRLKTIDSKKVTDLVEIKTVHSLAYNGIKNLLKGKNIGNLRAKDIEGILGFEKYKRPQKAYFLLKVFNEFLYQDYSMDEKGINDFIKNFLNDNMFWKNILVQNNIDASDIIKVISHIEVGNLNCPHDFYLKKYIEMLKKNNYYELFKEREYDIIILDESQDANPCFISLIKNLNANKVLLVGDRHQWIYSFKGSVNLFDSFDNIKKFYLTNTFRFGDNISSLANIILSYKGEKHLIKSLKSSIASDNKNKQIKENGIISRTNSELLKYYINLPFSHKEKVFFERDIHEIIKLPLTINLIINKISPISFCEKNNLQYSLVIDDLIFKLFPDNESLKKYIKEVINTNTNIVQQKNNSSVSTNNVNIETDILSAYSLAENIKSNDIISIINEYKKIKNEINSNIQMPIQQKTFLTTAHSSKGQEYKNVFLLNDYPDFSNNKEKTNINVSELNLLYVAITRAIDNISLSDIAIKNLNLLQKKMSDFNLNSNLSFDNNLPQNNNKFAKKQIKKK